MTGSNTGVKMIRIGMPSMKSPRTRMKVRMRSTAIVGFDDMPPSTPRTAEPNPAQASNQANDVAMAIRNIAAAVVTAASTKSFPISLRVSVR